MNHSENKFELRKRVHHLKPVVTLGQHGLTNAVQAEINIALEAHELIKIKINAPDKKSRLAIAHEICTYQKAQLIHSVGHMIAIYRKREE